MRKYQKDTVPASTRVKRGTYQLAEQWAKESGTSISDVLAQCIEQGVLRRQSWKRLASAEPQPYGGVPANRFHCGD